jgi:hypothetical protein
MRKRCIVESASELSSGKANDSETTHEAATLPSSREKRNGAIAPCAAALRGQGQSFERGMRPEPADEEASSAKDASF